VLLVPQIIQPPQFVVLEKCSFMFQFVSLLAGNYKTRSCLFALDLPLYRAAGSNDKLIITE